MRIIFCKSIKDLISSMKIFCLVGLRSKCLVPRAEIECATRTSVYPATASRTFPTVACGDVIPQLVWLARCSVKRLVSVGNARRRRDGDRFRPTWRDRPTKLKDFLRGQGVPLHRRDEVALICDQDDTVSIGNEAR